jgi:hypothetical protein
MKITRAHIALGVVLFFILLILLGRFVFFVPR